MMLAAVAIIGAMNEESESVAPARKAPRRITLARVSETRLERLVGRSAAP